jgi:uncharacterized delta-60 repeat protein
MPTSLPTFQNPGNGLSFVTASGSFASAPLVSQISALLPNGDYLIPGLLNGEVVMMAYTSSGQLDSGFNNGRGFIAAAGGARFSTTKPPIIGLDQSGGVFVSGETLSGKPAVLTYWGSGGLTGEIYSNSNISYVELPSGVDIKAIGNNWPTYVVVKSGSGSYLYSIQWDAAAEYFKLNNSFGSSGKITAPAGYNFTGSGSIYYQSVSPYAQIALLTATSSAGASVLLSYNTTTDTNGNTVPSATRNTSIGSRGEVTAPSGYTFMGGSFSIGESNTLIFATNAAGQSAGLVYKSNWTLDTAFGTSGVISVPSGMTLSSSSWPTYLSNGGVLLGGTDANGQRTYARYSSKGVLDEGFAGGTGILTAPTDYNVNGISSAGDYLFVSAYPTTGGESQYLVYNLDGTESSFAGGTLQAPEGYSASGQIGRLASGQYLLGANLINDYNNRGFFLVDDSSGAVGSTFFAPPSGYEFEYINKGSVALLPDDSLLAVFRPTTGGRLALLRFSSTGEDLGSITPPSGYEFLGVKALPDGNVVLHASSIGSSESRLAFIYSYNSVTGTLTKGVPGNTSGVVTIPSNFYPGDDFRTLADGSYIFSGINYDYQSVLVRYSAVGKLMTSFGSGGMVTAPVGITFTGGSQLSDGTLLIQGTNANGEPALIHYSLAGVLTTSFGTNGILTAPAGGSIQKTDNGYIIDGTEGDDTITAGPAAEVIGWGGNDLYLVTSPTATIAGNSGTGGNDTIKTALTNYSLSSSLVSGVNNLIYTGTAGASLTGNGMTGSVIGGVGADTLSDGGADATDITMIGGAGNDIYQVNSSSDKIVEAPSGGTDSIISTVDYNLTSAQNVENLVIGGTSQVFGTGNEVANSIKGNDGGNTLVGGDGSDTVVGGAGDDLIFAGNATFDLGQLQAPAGYTLNGVTVLKDDSFIAYGNTTDGANNPVLVRYLKNGTLDTAYGTGGIITAPAGYEGGWANVIWPGNGLVQPSLAGLQVQWQVWNEQTTQPTSTLAQYTAAGKIDTAFGNIGYVPNGYPQALSDGSFVTTTTSDGATSIQRFSKLGKSDATFGGGSGKLQAPAGVSLNGVTVLKDDSFIATGNTTDGTSTSVLVRYLKNGTLDTAYGTGGIITGGIPVNSMASGVTNLPSLAGLLVMSVEDGPDGNSTKLVKYSAFGKPDTIFGDNGSIVFQGSAFYPEYWPNGFFRAISSTGENSFKYLHILSDGSFIYSSGVPEGFLVQRRTASGKVDLAFAQGSTQLQVPAGISLSGEIRILKDDSFFVPGKTLDGSETPVLVHYLKNGVLDTGYGANGCIVGPLGYTDASLVPSDELSRPSLGGVIAWYSYSSDTNSYLYSSASYTVNGKLDTTFGNGGYVTNAYPQPLSDGNFVTTSSSDGVTFIQRFTKAGQLDLGFGSDTLGADSLVGGAGDDTLVSSAGVATLDGGTGNNTYFVNNSSVVVRQSTLNGDGGTVYTSVSYDMGRQATSVPNLSSNSASGVTLTGNSLRNSIDGGSGNDTLFGGGNDTLIGGGGVNTYIVNSTTDRIDNTAGDTLRSLIQSSVSFDLTSSLVSGVNNLIYTGNGNASLRGNGAANSITGAAGADTLIGGDGDDTLIGGGGINSLVGGAGANTYVVTSTTDRINDAGGIGSTVLSSVSYDLASSLAGGSNGTLANLTYTSTLGGSLKGNTLANSLTAGAGADTLFGGGNDTLIGRAGVNTYVVNSPADRIDNTGGDTLRSVIQSSASYDLSSSLVSGVNNLTYTSTLGGVLSGNSAANSLTGAAGADTLLGGGNDTLMGRAGANTYVVDATTNRIIDAGSGSVIRSSVAFDLGSSLVSGVNNLTYTDSVTGGVLRGNSAANSLRGAAANDTLFGAGGDTLIGGGGTNTYFVTGVTDRVDDTGGLGSTVNSSASYSLSLAGGANNLVYTSSLGGNLSGNTLANSISGNSGADTLFGGGNDTLLGGAGNDLYVVNSTTDTILDTLGNNTIQSGVSYDLSLASGVNNLVYVPTVSTLGGVLSGNSAANSLTGAAGADTLLGGGNDTLMGRAGANTYVVDATTNRIIDAGSGSVIRSSVAFDLGSSLVSGVNNLTYTGAAATLRGNDNANRIDASSATGAVSLNGGAGADTLIGSSLGDTLFGNGSSSLVGGAGANTYVVTSTTDRINDAGGIGSTVLSSVSYDLASSLAGGSNGTLANLTYTSTLGGSLRGNSSANSITGNTGADTLFGSAGADSLTDTLIGGAGNDLYVVNSTRDTIVDSSLTGGGVNTIQSSVSFDLASSLVSGVNNLTYVPTVSTLGGVLSGNSAANSLTGAAGADTLFGGGNDTLIGAGGANTYVVDAITNRIIDAGTGSVIRSSVAFDLNSSLVSGVNNLTYTGSGDVSLRGNASNNRIDASSAITAVSLNGGAGADTLLGGAGNDTLFGNGSSSLVGGAGANTYIVNSTTDRINDSLGSASTVQSSIFTNLASSLVSGVNNLVYTGASATLRGNDNANRIDASSATGAVSLNGGAGADTLIGSTFNDTLVGNGSSSLVGGAGNDLYILNSTTDRISDTGGNNTIHSSTFTNLASSLVSGVNNLVYASTLGGSLSGNTLANSISGNTGNDTIFGGDGNDTLKAFGRTGGTIQSTGFETDVMTGGAGADSFVLADTNGSFYLDSGKFYPGVTSYKSDASWCGITDFTVGEDQLVLSNKVWNSRGYSFKYYGDIKEDITPEVLSAFQSTTGSSPLNNDILLFEGNYDPQNGGFDFIAGIQNSSNQRLTDAQIQASYRLV